MNTRNNKRKGTNRTKKHRGTKTLTKTLNKSHKIYAAKSFPGDLILQYTKANEKKEKTKCIKNNISWFSNYGGAKLYKTQKTKIYAWETIKTTNLIKLEKISEKYINEQFENAKPNTLTPLIKTFSQKEKDHMEKSNITNEYVNMTPNEKAHYEFKFIFGYLSLKEQYNFLKLLAFSIENRILNMEQREKDVPIKLMIYAAINYYILNTSVSATQTTEKYNRISFYQIDKHVITNLCKVLSENNIDGAYQKKNTHSFWFPPSVLYRKNMEEYILFNPHQVIRFLREV